jgi:Spy/CpxP family protein refolding chaperone
VISAKLKAIGLLVGVFVLGAIAGTGGTLAFQTSNRLESHRFDPSRRGELSLQALTRRLDLSDAQQRKIAEILERHAPTRRRVMQEVMEQCGSAFREEKARLDDEIRAILNPQQRARFEQIAERQRERMFSPSGHPGRGRGGVGRGRDE